MVFCKMFSPIPWLSLALYSHSLWALCFASLILNPPFGRSSFSFSPLWSSHSLSLPSPLISMSWCLPPATVYFPSLLPFALSPSLLSSLFFSANTLVSSCLYWNPATSLLPLCCNYSMRTLIICILTHPTRDQVETDPCITLSEQHLVVLEQGWTRWEVVSEL